MKHTFAHILLYIVGGLTTVSALNPAAITAVIPNVNVSVLTAIIGLAGAILSALHAAGVNVTRTAPVSASAKQAGRIGIGMLACLASASMMVLVGCAAVEKFIGSPTGAIVVAAAVDVAVATAESKGVTAAEINKIAKAALAADSSTVATVATVTASVNAAISKANLPAGDQAAVLIVETALDAAIVAKVGNSTSVAAAEAAVADVLTPLIAATGG